MYFEPSRDNPCNIFLNLKSESYCFLRVFLKIYRLVHTYLNTNYILNVLLHLKHLGGVNFLKHIIPTYRNII